MATTKKASAQKTARKTAAAAKTGRRIPFVVRRSPIAGKGAFATRTIRKGERIVEYKGEHITSAEADRRYDDDETVPHHTFLFEVDEDDVIDATHGGNSSRYINHSCDPNCEAVIEDGRVFIEALRTIREGQELLYDYNYILDEPHTARVKKRYPCYCGAKNCRGTILGKKR